MNGLIARIIQAHGGIDRWNQYKKIEATIVSGGGFNSRVFSRTLLHVV
jgi:hypothetical protein